MDNISTDTVVQLTEEQYSELIQYLHTLDVKCGDINTVIKLLLALLLVYIVVKIWYEIITSITRYF